VKTDWPGLCLATHRSGFDTGQQCVGKKNP